MTLFKFKPFLQDVIWGGNKIAPLKCIELPSDTIGESWEISSYPDKESIVKDGPYEGLPLSKLIEQLKGKLVGEHIYQKHGNNFPLIVKFIDAKLDLSVQVHPNEQMQAAEGFKSKTEIWYILSADKGSKIYAGFKKKLEPSMLKEICADERILDYLARHATSKGNAFFLPSGCPHALGAGNLVLEIQQASDATFRIYDFGRLDHNGQPRELHLDEAQRALDYTVSDNSVTSYDEPLPNQTTQIRSCPYFSVKKAKVDGKYEIDMPHDSFMIIVGIDGKLNCTAEGQTLDIKKGETILVAATAKNLTFTGKGTVILTHA